MSTITTYVKLREELNLRITEDTFKSILKYYSSGKSLVKTSELCGCAKGTVSKVVCNSGVVIRGHRKIFFNENFFEKIDTEEKSYWLGFLMADGCIIRKKSQNIGVTLGLIDLPAVESFCATIGSTHKIRKVVKYFKNRLVSPLYQVSIYSKKLASDLVALNCTPKKSVSLQFPPRDKIPNELLRHFIRGYFDGDGSVYIEKNGSPKISICVTEQFANELIAIVQSELNFKLCLSEDRPIYSLRAWSTNAGRFLKWLYYDSKVYLLRKYNRAVLCFEYVGRSGHPQTRSPKYV